MKFLTIKQVLFRIAVVIAVVEFFIMSVLSITRPLPIIFEAILSPVLLVIISTAMIYYWIIKPFESERTTAMVQVNYLAHTDPLTQLANRRLVVTQLEKLISESIRYADYSAVLLLDLDGFKKVNDQYGHDAGDAVLVELAKRLSILVRSEDMVGRIGGDEFIVLISRMGTSEQRAYDKAQQTAKKLIELIGAPFVYQDNTLSVGVSIGVRLLGQELLNTEIAIRDADRSMFQAKKSGGNQAVIFEQEKNAQLF